MSELQHQMFKRLYDLGFYYESTYRYPNDIWARTVGGRRHLVVVFRGDEWLVRRWSDGMTDFAQPISTFSSIEEMEVAIVYQALANRRRAWPLTWFTRGAP